MIFQKALITGATSGIGEALARLLSSKNISLILTGRYEKKLADLSDELRKSASVVTFTANLEESQGQKLLIEMLHTHAPDLLINNAGFGIYGKAIDLSTQEQLKVLDINARLVLESTVEGAKALKAAGKRGVILNVSSAAGDYPTPGMAAYGASKSFVTAFSAAMDWELQGTGIRVLASCPGPVSTAFSLRAAKMQTQKPIPSSMSPTFAAEQIWKQIKKGKEKWIFDWRFRWGIGFFIHFVPSSFIKNLIWKRIQQRL